MALLPTDKRQQNILAVGIIAIVLAFGFYWFRHRKVKAEIATRTANVEALNDS